MLEDPQAQVLQHALADPADEVGLRVGGQEVDDRRDQERDDDEVERAEVAGHDAVVDRELGQRRRRQRGGGRGQQRERSSAIVAAAVGRAAAPAECRAACGPAGAHRPTTSGSSGLRVRKTWSGRPLAAISAYSGDCVEQLVVACRGRRTRPSLEHDDLVGQRDRRQPVGDHERRAARHHLAQRVLDLLLGRGVDATRSRRRGSGSAGRPAARARSRSAGAGRR